MKEVKGVLREWDFLSNRIYGKIYNNVSGEFEDGVNLLTSDVRHFSENGKFVHTENSIYELDPPVNLNKNTYDFKRSASLSFSSVSSPSEISVATWKTDEEVYKDG